VLLCPPPAHPAPTSNHCTAKAASPNPVYSWLARSLQPMQSQVLKTSFTNRRRLPTLACAQAAVIRQATNSPQVRTHINALKCAHTSMHPHLADTPPPNTHTQRHQPSHQFPSASVSAAVSCTRTSLLATSCTCRHPTRWSNLPFTRPGETAQHSMTQHGTGEHLQVCDLQTPYSLIQLAIH
jgi:hypothetical protein